MSIKYSPILTPWVTIASFSLMLAACDDPNPSEDGESTSDTEALEGTGDAEVGNSDGPVPVECGDSLDCTEPSESAAREELDVLALDGGGNDDVQAILIGSQLNCDDAGTTCSVKLMPQLNQTDWRLDDDVKAHGPWGCYDASITAVAITALANRTNQGSYSGRTALFSAISGKWAGTPPNEYYVPREVAQLSQVYRWADEDESQPPFTQPYHFPEVLRDFGPVAQQDCNPYVYGSCPFVTSANGVAFRDSTTTDLHVTHEYIKYLMRTDTAVMLGYLRYKPKAAWKPELGGYEVTFSTTGSDAMPLLPHKVALSGFQPGTYPLRVNDVGDGQQRKVRLSTDMSSRTYDGVAYASIKRFVFPNGLSKQTFIRHETDSDDLVRFVGQVDALALGRPGPTEVFNWTWGAGWTHLMGFTMNGNPHQIAYNAATGTVHFDRFWPDAQGVETKWSATWGSGWTEFSPYYVNSVPHFIAYNAATGAVHFDRVRADLGGMDILKVDTWPAGVTQIMPFTLNGSSYFLLYNGSTGAVWFMKINAGGDGSAQAWAGTWGAGWTSFMPYRKDGWPHLIAYNAATGTVHFDRINANLNGVQVLSAGTWASGWSLLPLDSKGLPFYTVFNSSGAARIDRIDTSCTGGRNAWTANWLPNATNAVSFEQNGEPYQLLYNKATGAVRAYRLKPF